jgi:catechol 2,3-dioxygenase-like lactoylglutathione lyase family enzyme
MIGQLAAVVLDCPDPRALAAFYRELLGWQIEDADESWVTLRGDGQVRLSFQRATDHRPPQWPDPSLPQQFHLDVAVEDLDVAEKDALGLGAVLLDSGEPGRTWRVFADPAGHPFCLCAC